MKVIRVGNFDGELTAPVAVTQICCKHCGSLMAVTQNEIQEDDCGAFHHSNHDCFCICGVCKSIIPLFSGSLQWGQ